MERMPTPLVGDSVWWFPGNDQENPRAAVVTQIEEPGKLKLAIQPPNGMVLHKSGVLHVTHPMHEHRHNSSTMNNGSWNYKGNPEAHRIPDAEWVVFDEKQAKMEQQRAKDEQAYREAAENKAKKLAKKDKVAV